MIDRAGTPGERQGIVLHHAVRPRAAAMQQCPTLDELCGASRNHVGNKARLRWWSLRRATSYGVGQCHRATTVTSPRHDGEVTAL
jgi:hypothetical protein